MKAGRNTIVLDPYNWLPGYGESGVRVRSEGLTWIVEIVYDDRSGTRLLKRELRFSGVCSFWMAAYPGASMLAMEFECSENAPGELGALLEYPDSEAALAWKRHFEGLFAVKHYAMRFLSENRQMHVFARDVVLTEPTVVTA